MSDSSEQRSGAPGVMPGARVALALLIGINLFNYVDRAVLASVEQGMSKDLLHGTEATVRALSGTLATVFVVSYMIFAPILGWAADRMSRWLIIGGSVILWSLASGGSGLAPTYGILLLTRMFVGVGEAGYGPSAPSVISDMYPIKRRGTVLAWFYMAIPVGTAIGYALGEIVQPHWGWRGAFYLVVPPGILLGLLCFFLKDPQRGRSDPGVISTRKPTPRDYLTLLKTRSYLLDSLGMAAMTFAIGGIQYWMPRYIESRGAGKHAQVIFGLILVVTGFSATLLGGMVADKLRGRFSGAYFWVSGVAIIISCPFILLMLHAPFPTTWVMIFVATFFLFFNTGPSNTILANVTHPSLRSSDFALNILLIHALGDVPSPPLLGWVSGKYGWDAAFTVVVIVMALAGLLWIWGARYLAADTAAAATRLEPSRQ